MAITLQNLLSQGEASEFGVVGRPFQYRRDLYVPVEFNVPSLEAAFGTISRQLTARAPANWNGPEITLLEMREYTEDVLAIRVASVLQDQGVDTNYRIPSQGIRNSLTHFPMFLNIIGAVGYVRYPKHALRLLPYIKDGVGDSSVRPERPVYLTIRNREKILTWFDAHIHVRLAMPVPVLPRDMDGVEAVMRGFWMQVDDKDTLVSGLDTEDANGAYIGHFVVQEGAAHAGLYYPCVVYHTREVYEGVTRELTRKEINIRKVEPATRPSTAKPKVELSAPDESVTIEMVDANPSTIVEHS